MSRLPSLGPRGEGWLTGQVVLFAAIIGAAWLSGSSLDEPALTVVRVVGVALIVLGILIVGLGARELDISLSPLPRPLPTGELVVHGPYRLVRHPIYVGVLVAALGGSVYTASLLAGLFTLVLAVWLDLKSRREEIWLRERYPGYADYAARTKRFVPGIY